jgi:hypothetical protein
MKVAGHEMPGKRVDMRIRLVGNGVVGIVAGLAFGRVRVRKPGNAQTPKSDRH